MAPRLVSELVRWLYGHFNVFCSPTCRYDEMWGLAPGISCVIADAFRLMGMESSVIPFLKSARMWHRVTVKKETVTAALAAAIITDHE